MGVIELTAKCYSCAGDGKCALPRADGGYNPCHHCGGGGRVPAKVRADFLKLRGLLDSGNVAGVEDLMASRKG